MPPLTLTPTRPKPRPKKAQPTEAAPLPGYRELVDHYFATFERVRGTRPAGFGAREGKSAKALLAIGLEEAKRRIDAAFADSFWALKVTINNIAAEPDKFCPPPPPPPEPPQRLPDHPPRKINTLEELDAWHAELRAEAKRKAPLLGPSALPFARDMYDEEPVEGGSS